MMYAFKVIALSGTILAVGACFFFVQKRVRTHNCGIQDFRTPEPVIGFIANRRICVRVLVFSRILPQHAWLLWSPRRAYPVCTRNSGFSHI